MASSSRPQTGIRLLTMVIGIALILTTLPATAQSPVAYPPIKLIHLYQHTCPTGVDPLAGSLTDAVDACPSAMPNVNFTLTSQDPTFAPQTHPTDSLGATEWHEVPSGFPYAIQQVVPAGYGNPVVRCQMGQNVQTNANFVELSFSAPGGRLDIGTNDLSLTYFMDNSCYWFDIPAGQIGPVSEAAQQVEEAVSDGGVPANTPTPTPLLSTESESEAAPQSEAVSQVDDAAEAGPSSPEAQAAAVGGARLDIRAWQCPFHYDAAVATVEELLTNCTKPHRDANFIINGDPGTQQHTGDIGATSYQHVLFGTVTIQQLAYASLDPARVFCYTQPFTAPHGPLQASQEIGFTEESGDTFSVSIDVDPGDAIDCIWFDAMITEDDLGTVLLHKYVCANSTATTGLDLNALLQVCSQPQVAYFQLVDPSGSSILGLRTDSNGYVGFIDFDPGSFTIREVAPLGYAPTRILCRSYNADDWNHVVDPYVDQAITNNSGFAVQIQAHWETECYLFDIEGVNHGYLDIIAESCPSNFNPTATTPYLTYAQRCRNGVSGAAFFITGNPDFAHSATSINGVALFQQHVPAGLMDIQSTPPQTYATLNVFCGDAPYIGIGAIPTSWTSFPDGFVRYDVPVDYQVVCKFYYKPIAIVAGEETSPATITTAPEEDESDASEEESSAPEASPTTAPSEESTGEIDGQAGSAENNQGAQGTSTEGNQNPSEGTSATSQTPVDVNAPATLSFAAFSCPPGFELYARGASPSGNCQEPTAGVAFTLTGEDQPALAATSNAGGALAWTGLAPGSYLLQAALPADTGGAFIADCRSDQRTLTEGDPLTPIAFVGPEGQIGITLLAGETLDCRWYAIPVSNGGGVTGQLFSCPGVTVIKSQCVPGTGPATLTFDPAPGESVSPFELQFAGDGTAQATAGAGTYALTGIPIDACLVESDAFDASGQLVLQGGAAVEVRVYICGGA